MFLVVDFDFFCLLITLVDLSEANVVAQAVLNLAIPNVTLSLFYDAMFVHGNANVKKSNERRFMRVVGN